MTDLDEPTNTGGEQYSSPPPAESAPHTQDTPTQQQQQQMVAPQPAPAPARALTGMGMRRVATMDRLCAFDSSSDDDDDSDEAEDCSLPLPLPLALGAGAGAGLSRVEVRPQDDSHSYNGHYGKALYDRVDDDDDDAGYASDDEGDLTDCFTLYSAPASLFENDKFDDDDGEDGEEGQQQGDPSSIPIVTMPRRTRFAATAHGCEMLGRTTDPYPLPGNDGDTLDLQLDGSYDQDETVFEFEGSDAEAAELGYSFNARIARRQAKAKSHSIDALFSLEDERDQSSTDQGGPHTLHRTKSGTGLSTGLGLGSGSVSSYGLPRIDSDSSVDTLYFSVPPEPDAYGGIEARANAHRHRLTGQASEPICIPTVRRGQAERDTHDQSFSVDPCGFSYACGVSVSTSAMAMREESSIFMCDFEL